MFKIANDFINELYERMPIDSNHPYFDMMPEDFFAKYPRLFEFYQDNYVDIMPNNKTAEILDVGFGFGWFMIFAKLNGFINLHGIEYNIEQVKNIEKIGFNGEKINDLKEYLKTNPESYDLIHLSNVIEHFPKYDLIEIFDLIHSCLKPGGKVIVVVPNIASWRGNYIRYLVLGHEIGFTEISLKQLFDVTNFSIMNIFSSRIRFKLRIKNILQKLGQFTIDKIRSGIDYLYLGSNRPKHRGDYLIGVGYKAQG